MYKRLLFITVLMSQFGCEISGVANENEIISATACATQLSDGTVVECEATKDQLDEVKNFHNSYAQISSESPGPTGPDLLNIEENKFFIVSTITNDNVIVLETGQEIILAGVECKLSELNKYLINTFMANKAKAKAAYKETGLSINNRIYAYVWEVRISDDTSSGPSVSSINENAITSEYCVPIEQQHHTYNERYNKLARLAQQN